jgi:hypothetical protein
MLFFGNLLKEMRRHRAPRETGPQRADRHHHDPARPLRSGRAPTRSRFLTGIPSRSSAWCVVSFCVATAAGVLFAKAMNLFLKNNKINPIIGAAGVSAVPDSARVVPDGRRAERTRKTS